MNFFKFLFIIGFFFLASPLLMAEAAAPAKPSAACDNSAATRSSIKVTWAAVTGVSSYGYKIGSDGVVASTTTTSVSLDNLESGQGYNINIQACSASECSGFAVINCLTNPAKPELTFSKTSASIILEWSRIDGASVYQIGYKKDGEEAYTYEEIANKFFPGAYTIKNLASNTLYNVKVQACNANKKDNDGNKEYDEGCSDFIPQKITTTKEQGIEDLRNDYEKKNLRMQKTLNGYKSYMEKSGELEEATRNDFTSEVESISQSLASDLTYVKSETNIDNINGKLSTLDSTFKVQVELLKYKLKIYKKCDGYYTKFKDYKFKVENFSQIPGDAKGNFNDSNGHIDKAIDHYRVSYERAVLSNKLPVTNSVSNLVIIKSLYNDLGKDGQYKLTKLIYTSLYYVNKVNEKLVKFKEYSDSTNKKYLSGVFTDTAIKTAYDKIIDDFIIYYKGYVGAKSWNDFAAVSNDNSFLKKDGRYKRAAKILKGLSNINSIIAKAEKYKSEIDGYGGVTSSIKGKADELENNVIMWLRYGQLSLGKRIINLDEDSDKIYKEIKSYFVHKIFYYLYSGSKSLNKLNININNIEKVIEVIGSCPEATGNINSAKGKVADASGKLENINYDNLDSAKEKYSEFKNFYKEALNYYKTAISESKKCL
ncbi:MAG: fibronectin type III domain-containing protein [Patescibacteria group bacterium]|nr:fibronectin type III domain-containing protein [Patescibacteria group bacterium]MDD5295132.1 fibronectin type III domain-containing protein [Patescibacteria group bacterium]MDD5554015.1 fibronectin type III domain-containing protein [Patescibacteria group bacterium]